jgi:hypothetical protein
MERLPAVSVVYRAAKPFLHMHNRPLAEQMFRVGVCGGQLAQDLPQSREPAAVTIANGNVVATGNAMAAVSASGKKHKSKAA